MSQYTYQYNNETGEMDEGFWEFYELYDPNGECIGRIDKEEDAKKVCAALNGVSEMLETLQYVVKTIEDMDGTWWIDCPSKGGFDVNKIESVISKYKPL